MLLWLPIMNYKVDVEEDPKPSHIIDSQAFWDDLEWVKWQNSQSCNDDTRIENDLYRERATPRFVRNKSNWDDSIPKSCYEDSRWMLKSEKKVGLWGSVTDGSTQQCSAKEKEQLLQVRKRCELESDSDWSRIHEKNMIGFGHDGVKFKRMISRG